MGCISPPALPAPPALPSPLSLSPPALPPLDLSIDFCCRYDLISWHPTIPLGPAVLAIPGASAVVILVNQAMDAIKPYLDAIALDCPNL